MTLLNFLMEVLLSPLIFALRYPSVFSLMSETGYVGIFFVINLDFGGSIADFNLAGPLVEYERRIAAGELVDGDSCQVWPAVSPASSSFIFRDESGS